MAIAENKLQEELCKDCIYKQRIHENMLYCPFGHCLWQEYSITVNGKIKTINYINRFSNCRKSVAVYVTEKEAQ